MFDENLINRMQTILRQAIKNAKDNGFDNLTDVKRIIVNKILNDILCIFEQKVSYKLNYDFNNSFFSTTENAQLLLENLYDEYETILNELKNNEFSINEDEYPDKITPIVFQYFYVKLYYLFSVK